MENNKATLTGARIREQRIAKGFTLKDLADKLCVQYQTIQAWESGRRFPKEETIQKIASALEVTADYLSGRTNDPHTRLATQEDIDRYFGKSSYTKNEGMEINLKYYFNLLNDEGKAVAVDRVKELSEIPRYKK